MWLKELRIQHLESHLDTTLTFSKHTNSIIGGNGVGKSSIFRALSLLLHNKPSRGGAYITQGKQTCTITGTFMDGDTEYKLSRKKSSEGSPTYTITLPTGTNRKYNVDGDLPEDITSLFHTGDTLQAQRNQQYIVFESSGNMARTFREAFGLSKLDSLNTAIKAMLKDSSTACETARVVNGKYFSSLALFDRVNFPAIETDLNKSASLLKELDLLKSNFIFIRSSIQEIIDSNQSIVELQGKLLPETLETTVGLDLQALSNLEDACASMSPLYNDLTAVEHEISSTKVVDVPDMEEELQAYSALCSKANIIKELVDSLDACPVDDSKVLEVPDMEEDIKTLYMLAQKEQDIRDLYLDLESAEDSCQGYANKIQAHAEELEQVKKELGSLTCDKCGTLLTGEALKTYMESV